MQLITNTSLLEQKEHGTFNFPLLVSFEDLSSYDAGCFLLHWHPEVELTLVVKGEMLYKVNNDTIHLREGDALFCNSGALHSGRMRDSNACKYISITFDSRLIYGYEKSAIYNNYVLPIIQDLSLSYVYFDCGKDWAKDAINEMKNIVSLYNATPTGYEFDIIGSLYKIWKIIYNNVSSKKQNIEVTSLNLSRFRSMISYIELNYGEKITLRDLAAHIHLCEEECCRLFKSVMNMSIFDYIQEYRIKKACKFLAETKFSITEIACMVGYNDSNYFSKTFRKYEGISPREYRKQYSK